MQMSTKKSEENQTRIVMYLFGSAVVIGIVGYVIYRADSQAQGVSAFLGVFGSLCSIAGLAFTCYQVLKIKRLSEATNEAAKEALAQYDKMVTISDVTRYSAIIEDITTNIYLRDHRMVAFRIRELNDFFQKAVNNAQITQFFKVDSRFKENFDRAIFDLNMDHRNLLNVALDSAEKVEFGVIFRHVCSAKDVLCTIESKFKKINL